MSLRSVALLAASCLLGCNSGGTCDLPAQLRYTAGDDAIACGRAPLDDTATVDECVIASFGQSLPFYAEYELQGEDSKLVLGLARDASGEITFFQLDEDPSGSKTGEVIDTYGCSEPTLDAERERTPPNVSPVRCESFESFGRACG